MKTENDLEGKTYIHCCACMSVWADALSWANANVEKITTDHEEAENIVILGCQVTDLAVLNDLRVTERLMKEHSEATFFMGGCLAQRDDINLGITDLFRIEPLRSDYTLIKDKTLVSLEKPFWVNDFKEDGEVNENQGNLFRNHYPLRISVGCQGSCAFCAIKHTRAGAYDLDVNRLKEEMIWADSNGFPILLIADSPQLEQLLALIEHAFVYNIHLSLRNVEPDVMCSIGGSEMFSEFVYNGLLDYCHSPLQSMGHKILKDMKRSVKKTEQAFDILCRIRRDGVKIATNAIIDYKGAPDPSLEIFNDHFDYVSWNPLWDGKWDRKKAEKRFTHYSKQF